MKRSCEAEIVLQAVKDWSLPVADMNIAIIPQITEVGSLQGLSDGVARLALAGSSYLLWVADRWISEVWARN